MQRIRCPRCGDNVLHKSTDGKVRLRIRGAFWEDDGKCYGVCSGCKTPVGIPLVVLGTPVSEERLVVLDGSKK